MHAGLKKITKDDRWNGYFDGFTPQGSLKGWAFLKENPSEDVELHLYIHGIWLATTAANQPRPDVDTKLNLKKPSNTGFLFDLKAFNSEGALKLMRKFGRTPPKVNLLEDLHIYIAGSQLALPTRQSSPDINIDLSDCLPSIIAAAARQLREELSTGLDINQLSSVDQEILLLSNPLFDAKWYAETYDEIQITEIDPTEHYRRFASDFERAPSPWFDPSSYLAVAPEARAASISPVIHYDLYGHDQWWPGQGKFRECSSTTVGERDHAVLIHLYHLDTVPDIQKLVLNFEDDVDVFVSVPDNSPDHDPAKISALFPRACEIIQVPNRGQDVAAFLEVVRQIKGRGYRFFCKVHSKKGNKYPDIWRRVMFDALAATPDRIAQTVELFRSNPRVLIAGPKQFWLNGADFELGSGPRLCEFLAELGIGDGAVNQDWGFFAGTCFWIDAELAGLIAEALPMSVFDEAKVTSSGQAAFAVERLFSLVCIALGGQVGLIDGCDWTSAPVISNAKDRGIRLPEGEKPLLFLSQHLQGIMAPRIVPGTALQPKEIDPNDLFANADSALHGEIDVMVCCWNGGTELLQRGFCDLGRHLELQGLTWAIIVSSPAVQSYFQADSCRNLIRDTLYLRFPLSHQNIPMPIGMDLPETVSLSLLRSEHLFLRTDLPEGEDLQAALANIGELYAYWRGILTRHKIKTFLIWGNTAPKSRLFIHLCTELGIEYQIIERGHFPGTISIDPIGQFGTGVTPRLVSHASTLASGGPNNQERFQEIRAWYDAQQNHAAYAQFQKRGTRDLDIMARARSQKRPVILVIGGNDQGGGVVTPDPDLLRVNWFGSSDQAFKLIRGLVSSKFPDALLVLRPHPSQTTQTGEFLLVARDSALDELVENADLCISIATTASAICLLKGKPLLTLGLSELNGAGVGEAITDETHLLAALRRHIWASFPNPYPDGANRRFIVDLFDRHLVGIDGTVPTHQDVTDLAALIASRIQRMKTGFLQDFAGREDQISQAMFEDVRDRGRAIFPVDPRAFSHRKRPEISVVLPIYGDYEGTRICFDQLVRHQEENGYRVIVVWDRGPDERLRDLCIEYADKAGFTYLENRENVGFSGTVNQGILHAGRDDIILLNSDTVPCGDWALRLQDAAYAHPKISSVVPFSNNATIYSVPFPDGKELPTSDPVSWVEAFDRKARTRTPFVVEMPISHGYCTYVRRSVFNQLGLFSESKFDKGHGEDNEFSMRARAAGYFCGCATQIFIGHAGSTSFAEDAMKWKLAGREAMQKEFSHYFDEVRSFFKNDPLWSFRQGIDERPLLTDGRQTDSLGLPHRKI